MQGRHSALHIIVDDHTRATLQGWLRKQQTPVALAKRARAIVLLADGQTFLEPGRLARFLAQFVEACGSLSKLRAGFALYKREAPSFKTHTACLGHYARRYWERVRPHYADSDVATIIDHWVAIGLGDACSRAPSPYRVTAVDANLKNFIVGDDGTMTVLNVPIAGYSSRAHAVGAVGVHLRNLPAYEPFMAMAGAHLEPHEKATVLHFEAWTLLGILSFYAERAPAHMHEQRNWGAPIPLCQDLANLARQLPHLRGV